MRMRTRPTSISTSKTISTGSRRSRISTRIWQRFSVAPNETRNSPLPCCELECISRLDLQTVLRRPFLLATPTRGLPPAIFCPPRMLRASAICRGRSRGFRGRRHNARMTQREYRQDSGTAEPSRQWGASETQPSEKESVPPGLVEQDGGNGGRERDPRRLPDVRGNRTWEISSCFGLNRQLPLEWQQRGKNSSLTSHKFRIVQGNIARRRKGDLSVLQRQTFFEERRRNRRRKAPTLVPRLRSG